jgi:hypothetical protein
MSKITPEAQARKDQPVCTGCLDYFPDALLAVGELSRIGNEQHNPGEPLHWAKEKSTDEADALVRHLLDRGKLDSDGVRHTVKVAWRALALLQRELDREKERDYIRLNPEVTMSVSEFGRPGPCCFCPICVGGLKTYDEIQRENL